MDERENQDIGGSQEQAPVMPIDNGVDRGVYVNKEAGNNQEGQTTVTEETSKKNTKKIIGIVVAALLVVIIGCGAAFASWGGGAKGGLLKAIVKTTAAQQANAEEFLSGMPGMNTATADWGDVSNAAFRFRVNEVSGVEDAAYVGALLKDSGIDIATTTNGEQFQYDFSFIFQNAVLFDLNAYEDANRLMFGIPEMIDTNYYIDFQTAEKDFKNSLWAEQLTKEDFEHIVSEIRDFQTSSTLTEKDMAGFSKQSLKILNNIYKQCKVTEEKGAEGKKVYQLSVPGRAVKAGITDWMRYACLESPLKETYRTTFSAMYSEAPTMDPDVYHGSYEDFMEDTIWQMEEALPEINHDITIYVNQDGLIESFTGTGAAAKDSKNAIYIDSVKLDGKLGENADMGYHMVIKDVSQKVNLDFNLGNAYRDNKMTSKFDIVMHDDVSNMVMACIVAADRNTGKLDASVNFTIKDGSDGTDGKFVLGLTVDMVEDGEAVKYNNGSIYFDFEDLAGLNPAIDDPFVIKADIGFDGIVKPIEKMPVFPEAKNILTLQEDEMADLTEASAVYAESMIGKLYGILFSTYSEYGDMVTY